MKYSTFRTALCTGFFILLLGSNFVSGQMSPKEKLSMLDAYQLAKSSDPTLAIARYRVDGAEARKSIARSRILPQLSLFGQYSKNEVEYDASPMFQDQNYSGERYGLQFRQALLHVSDGLEARRLGLLYKQTQQEFEVAERELLSKLVQAYLGVLLADLDVIQLVSELNALERELEAANALFQRDLLPVTQVLETQTRKEVLGADVIMVKGNAAIAREELIKITGSRGIQIMDVRDRISLMSRFNSADQAALESVKSSPAVAAAETAVAAARKAIDRERGTWIPEIDLTFTHQYSDVGFDNLSSPPRDTSIVAIGFNYPLYEGGAGSARLRGAWAEYYTAQIGLQAVQRESEARARSAWLNLKAVTEHVTAARQAVRTAEISVDASRKAVKAGTARVTDVLLALSQNTRSQRDLGMAKFQYVLGWLELELATGGDPVSLAPTLSLALHGQ